MDKRINKMLGLLPILVTIVKTKIDVACEEVIHKLPEYECSDSKPVGTGKESVVYLIKTKDTDILRTLKISKPDALRVEEEPQITYLKALEDVPQVATFFPPAHIISLENDKYLLMVLEYGRYGDLEHLINIMPFHFKTDHLLFAFCLELVKGLKEIHKRGIIHASIKPQNIIVMNDYSPKYIDFNWSVPINVPNYSRGDHLFNAPEVLLNRGHKVNWDASKDVYSLGGVFYYMIHGHVPFNGINRFFHRRAVERKKYLIKAGIRADFLEIIQKCMKWEPKDRATLDEIEELLYEAQDNTSPSKLPKDKVANLYNNSLEDCSLLDIDPLLLIIGSGCAILGLLIIFIIISATRKSNNVPTVTRTELVTNDNNL